MFQTSVHGLECTGSILMIDHLNKVYLAHTSKPEFRNSKHSSACMCLTLNKTSLFKQRARDLAWQMYLLLLIILHQATRKLQSYCIYKLGRFKGAVGGSWDCGSLFKPSMLVLTWVISSSISGVPQFIYLNSISTYCQKWYRSSTMNSFSSLLFRNSIILSKSMLIVKNKTLLLMTKIQC